MRTPEDITDALIHTYTRVLPAGPGICSVCHGQVDGDWETCYVCNRKIRPQVTHFCRRVVPISLAEPDSTFHHAMKYYKEPGLQAVRHQRELGALLHRFIDMHGQCIRRAARTIWDTVTIVPSSKGRDPHPLATVVQMSGPLLDVYRPLLARGPGEIGHQKAADDGYVPIEDVRGRRVLLIDDTFTSGARSQSAASALELAGAMVVAIVTLERHVNRDWSATMIDAASEVPFSFDTCCLENALRVER